MLVRTEKIDPKDYPFKKFIDEQKHLDTDESRHLIKPIRHKIDECLKGKEHLFCDKEQLCPLGKFRRPKKLIEAEQRGFANVKEMLDADQKAEEDAKEERFNKQQQELDELKAIIKNLIISVKTKDTK
jgi:hypothetical protein